ncbi:MAG TPA: hypothetical protein VF260_08445 [Bacilli bacterium]
MPYCPNCGAQLQEGESHVCAQNQEQAPVAARTFEKDVLVKLLKNPFNALELNPEKDLIYGVIGFASSVIGFFIWGWAQFATLLNAFSAILGFGGGFPTFSGSGTWGFSLRFLLLGAISLAALLTSLWLIGNWCGAVKRSPRETITRLGALQFPFGACFLVAAFAALISLMKISLLIAALTTLVSLLCTVEAAIDCFQVAKDNRFKFIAYGMVVYAVAVGLIAPLFL